MSANTPESINIQLCQWGITDFQQFLRSEERKRATHVVIELDVVDAPPNGDFKMLIYGDGEVLVERNVDLLNWISVIISQVPSLAHVTVSTNLVERDDDDNNQHLVVNYLPLDFLGVLFQHTQEKLISLNFQCHPLLLLWGDKEEYFDALRHLQGIKKLEKFCIGLEESVALWMQADLADQHLLDETLCDILNGLPTLRQVAFPTYLTPAPSGITCLQKLQRNQTIESLWLRMFAGCDGDDGNPTYDIDQFALQFQEFIEEGMNNNLTSLSLKWDDRSTSPSQGTKVVLSVFQGLVRNESLSSLEIHLSNVPSGEMKGTADSINNRLQQVLKKNASIKVLNINASQTDAKERLELSDATKFWLKINQLGRKELLQDLLNHKDWLTTLCENFYDHQVTYFLLHSNPSAFIPYLQRVTSYDPLIRTHKRRRTIK